MTNRKWWLACGEPRSMLSYLKRQVNFEKAETRRLRLFVEACRAAHDGKTGSSGEWAKLNTDVAVRASVDFWTGGTVPNDRHVIAAIFRDVFGDPWKLISLTVDCWDCDGHGLLDPDTGVGFDEGVSCDGCNGNGKRNPPRWLTPQILSLAQAAYDDRQRDGTLDAARLAVLSDALEEAGCADAYILRHLRGEEVCPECLGEPSKPLMGGGMMRIGSGPPMRVTSAAIVCDRCLGKGLIAKRGPCYRGCHVVDRLLGKA